MSSSYSSFYTGSHIPCSGDDYSQELGQMGLASKNIDGNYVKGGIAMFGSCHAGGTVGPRGYGAASPNSLIMWHSPCQYSNANGTTSNNANSAKNCLGL